MPDKSDQHRELSAADVSEVIELAWRDEVAFDDITAQTGLTEREVIAIMRRELKPGSFRTWRKRVSGRSAKHKARQRG